MAKRRKARMTEQFFRDNAGFKMGCEVSISDSQDDPVKVEMDGMVATFTYGRKWLDEILDNPAHSTTSSIYLSSLMRASYSRIPGRPGCIREISDDDPAITVAKPRAWLPGPIRFGRRHPGCTEVGVMGAAALPDRAGQVRRDRLDQAVVSVAVTS